MTQEEKDQHEMELCGDLIPRLCEDTVWNEIEKLSVQDTITVRKQAISALQNGVLDDMFNNTYFRRDTFEEAIAMLGRLIPKKLMALPNLYVMIDDSTQLPFLDEGGLMYLFSEEEFANDALDYYLQQMRNWSVERIEQESIYPFLGHEFYDCGALGAIIDNGQNYSRHKPEEFVARPDLSGVPEDKRPISNPDYVRALSMVQQERNWRINYPDKNKVFTAYEDEMIRTFVKARFLVPFKTTGDNSGSFNKGDRITFASIQDADGNYAMPVFSDWDEFAKYYDPKEWKGWVMTAEDLLQGPAEAVVFNVETNAFRMTKQFMKQVFSIYQSFGEAER